MAFAPVLLFDLGGVLVESSGQAALGALLPHLERAEILARWHQSTAVRLFECGSVTPEAFAQLFSAEWGLQLSPTEFLAAFASWVRGLYPGARELLQQLRTRHTVACLSNTNSTHWARLTEVQYLFDVCVPSHLIGCMKPDPAAYKRALQELMASADDVYFFDDLLPNVLAARTVGMRSFHVQGLAATVAALRDAGVNTDGYA